MNHQDHVSLIRPGIPTPGGVWADFGSGTGAFTLALRDIVGAEAEIFSIDKDRNALQEQGREFTRRFGATRGENPHLHFIQSDLMRLKAQQDVPPLDGIIMANVLHYFPDASRAPHLLTKLRDVPIKVQVLTHLRTFLKPNGGLILIEYNVDVGNMWVPYPLSYSTYQQLAPRAGFTTPRLLATIPSRFLNEFYSASSNPV